MKLSGLAIVLALLCVLALSSTHLRAEDVVVPEGVRYHKATNAVNASAKLLLLQYAYGRLSQQELQETFAKSNVICGPGLWADMKLPVEKNGLKYIPVTMHCPMQINGDIVYAEKKGGCFRGQKDCVAFLALLQARSFKNAKSITIRKATPPELSYLWVNIGVDIEEPLFVIQTEKARYIVTFNLDENDKPGLIWMDIVVDLPAR